MKSFGSKKIGSKKIVWRVAAALMVSTAPFVAIQHVHAQTTPACTPATATDAPVNGQTVTCTGGIITNQNDPNGYGTGVETGNTIIVDPSTTVTGTSVGISVNDATVTNNGGTITGGSSGLFFNGDSIVNNGSDPNNAAVHGTISGATEFRPIHRSLSSMTARSRAPAHPALALTPHSAPPQSPTTVRAPLQALSRASWRRLSTFLATTAQSNPRAAPRSAPVQIRLARLTRAVDGTITLTNGSSGTIRANAANGVAVVAFGTGTITINSNDGMIQADGGKDVRGGAGSGSAVVAAGITINSNTGTIEATGQNGIAINASEFRWYGNRHQLRYYLWRPSAASSPKVC